jgi:hypothetical protein
MEQSTTREIHNCFDTGKKAKKTERLEAHAIAANAPLITQKNATAICAVVNNELVLVVVNLSFCSFNVTNKMD